MRLLLPIVSLATVGGLFALASAQSAGQQPKSVDTRVNFSMDFELFRENYSKHYANGAELARRAKLFMARALKVFISRAKYMLRETSKFLKITSRSDWTPEERDRITSDDREDTEATQVDSSAPPGDLERLVRDESRVSASFADRAARLRSLLLPEAGFSGSSSPAQTSERQAGQGELAKRIAVDGADGLDYRDTGCFLLPKDQRQCGACYAFTTVSLMEFHRCRQMGKLVSFSEQYVIDCGRERFARLHGCHGGFSSDAGHFVARYGLELSADYPFRGEDSLACPYGRETEPAQMGHTRVGGAEVVMIGDQRYLKPALIRYLLEVKGPLFVSLKTGDDFVDYGGGVDQPRCDPRKDGAHAMVLVGHGTDNGLDYWLMRNSHGVEFGDQGYYKLDRDVPSHCLRRVGYVEGSFRLNTSHRGKSLFDELKKNNLLARHHPA